MTPPHARVFLTGYRGTGKTTVARLLADAIGWKWVDTDDLVEQAAGTSIAEFFAERGEPAFRELEQQVVIEATDLSQTVIALGGGAILSDASRERIDLAGPIVWLTADAKTLAARLAADATTGARRPNLTAQGGLAEIEQVLAQRAPIYRASADLEISTMRRSPASIVDEIAQRLGLVG